MIIRNCKLNDLDNVHHLIFNSLHNQLHENDLNSGNSKSIRSHLKNVIDEELIKREEGLVLEIGGKVIGFVGHYFQESPFIKGNLECIVFPLALDSSQCNYQLVESLLNPIEIKARQKNCQFIYLEIPSTAKPLLNILNTMNWEANGIFIRKKTQSHHSISNTGNLLIRKAKISDQSFIIKCLSKSIWDGLKEDEKIKTNQEYISQVIHRLYNPLFDKNRLVFVAEWNNELCGFTFAEINNPNRYTGDSDAELIDTFVLEKYERKGIAQALTNTIDTRLNQIGNKHIVGNFRFENEAYDKKVLNSLYQQGWWKHSTLLYKTIN